MEKEFMLTTYDNPYDPFTQFEDWYNYDTQNGYFTCSYLGRISHTSPELPDSDNSIEIENAMNDICNLHPSLYKIVYKSK